MTADPMTGIERLKALRETAMLKPGRDQAADTKNWALYESLHTPGAGFPPGING